MPEAPISGRHVLAHVSGVPSANKVKRMGDELSALPATGSAGTGGGNAAPVIGESASVRHTDATVLGNERDIRSPCRSGIDALPECLASSPPEARA
jgi:hypothetical protein